MLFSVVILSSQLIQVHSLGALLDLSVLVHLCTILPCGSYVLSVMDICLRKIVCFIARVWYSHHINTSVMGSPADDTCVNKIVFQQILDVLILYFTPSVHLHVLRSILPMQAVLQVIPVSSARCTNTLFCSLSEIISKIWHPHHSFASCRSGG